MSMEHEPKTMVALSTDDVIFALKRPIAAIEETVFNFLIQHARREMFIEH
jgi:hypothetical protein